MPVTSDFLEMPETSELARCAADGSDSVGPTCSEFRILRRLI